MYDKNDEPWDLEAYLATISDPEERARTRREDGGLGYDEDGALAYVPSFGSGPEARLNRAIGGADDDVNLDAELTVDDLVALPFPAGSEACEVDFLTGEPLEGPCLADLIALPWPLDGHCYDVDFDTGERLIERSRVLPRKPLDPVSEEHLDRLGHAYAERCIKAETERLHAHPDGVKSRNALLRNEVPRLYNAFSYFNHSRGLTMNTFLTVSYEALGVYDHRDAMKLHGKLNDKLQNWLAVGLVPKVARRRRVSARAQIQSSEHFYGYVVENARNMRFHVHQLMWVPPVTQQLGDHGRHIYKATLMAHEARLWLAKQVGSHAIPYEAVDVNFHAPSSLDADLRWQWDRFRYMAKCLSPTSAYPDGKGGLVNGRELFKPDPFKAMRPVFCPQLAGGSHNIWKLAQQEAGFVSMCDAYEDTELYSDWALRAYEKRIEAEQRATGPYELLDSLIM